MNSGSTEMDIILIAKAAERIAAALEQQNELMGDLSMHQERIAAALERIAETMVLADR